MASLMAVAVLSATDVIVRLNEVEVNGNAKVTQTFLARGGLRQMLSPSNVRVSLVKLRSTSTKNIKGPPKMLDPFSWFFGDKV